MARLDPAIHAVPRAVAVAAPRQRRRIRHPVDARVKPGHDGQKTGEGPSLMSGPLPLASRMPLFAPPRTRARVALRPLVWVRENLFNGWFNSLLTLAVLALLGLILPPFLRWAVERATLWGNTRNVCAAGGACWTFIRVHLSTFFFGHYPDDQRWRVGLAFVLMAGFCVPVLRARTRHRARYVAALILLFPILAGVLLAGGVPGLPWVDTNQWGGLMLNVVISFVTVAFSLPLGVVLALGRRSRLMLIRMLSVGFIELWRGVPLLTVLFMSAVMVPLFLPQGVSIDRLVRALVALVLFNAAYMAEVVRGGLQGVPRGQDEAAYSLGLRWWQVQACVVLPQALKIVVPGIINTVVDLFKDTTLVTIVGLFDLLGAISQGLKDPAWLGFATEGYVFSAIVFFVCCFAMSSYGRAFERRLAATG
jgi:general L-amino acid transport system permease protein